MKRRCRDVKNKSYNNYGGRGISYCEKWEKFLGFLEDMGIQPKGYMLDRIDNDGNYCKENCRWATRKEQMNNSRNNRRFTINGETKTSSEWAKKLNIKQNVLNMRIDYYGWDLLRALTTLPRKHNRKHK